MLGQRRTSALMSSKASSSSSSLLAEPDTEQKDVAFAFWYSTYSHPNSNELPPVCFDGLLSATKVFDVRLLCYDLSLQVPDGVTKTDCNSLLDKTVFLDLLEKQAGLQC
jgi:hypothetical protein